MKRTSKRQWIKRAILSLVFVLGCAFFCLQGTQAYFKTQINAPSRFNLRIFKSAEKLTLKEEDGTEIATTKKSEDGTEITTSTPLLLPNGRAQSLTAEITPADAYDQQVFWTSSNESVVAVDSLGRITAKADEGTATITATIYNDDKKTNDAIISASFTVQVGKAVQSIVVDKSTVNFTGKGQTETLTATITPADALVPDVIWASTDSGVTKIVGDPVVDSTMGTATVTIEAVAAGKATIKAIAADGDDYAECLVQCKEPIKTIPEFLNVSTDYLFDLPASVQGADGVEIPLSWVSSDPTVAAVGEDGYILAKKAGAVTLTADDGTQTYTVTVEVLGDQLTFKNHYYTPEGNFSFKAYNVSEVKFNDVTLADDEYVREGDLFTIPKATLAAKTTRKNNTLTFASETSANASVNVRILEAAFTSFEAGEVGAEVINPLSNVGEATLIGTTGNHSVSLPITATKAQQWATFGLHPDYVKAMFASPALVSLDIKGQLVGMADEAATGHFGASVDDNGNVIWKALSDTTAGNAFSIQLNRADYNYFCENDDEGRWKENVNINAEGIYNTGEGAFEITEIIGHWETGSSGGDPNLVRRVFFDLQVSQGRGFTLPLNTKDAYILDKDWQTLDDYSTTIHDGILNKTESSWRIAGPEQTRYDMSYAFVTSRVFADDSQYVLVGDGITGSYTYPLYANADTHSLRITNATLNGVDIVGGGVTGVTCTDTGVQFDKQALATMLGHNRLEMRVERTQTTWNRLYTTIDNYCVTVCAVTQKDYDGMANAVTFEDGRLSPFMCVLNAYSEVVDSTVMNRSNFNYANEASYVMPDGSTRQNNKVLKVTTKKNLSPQILLKDEYLVTRYEALTAAGKLDGREETAYLFRATMYGVYNDTFTYRTYWASTLNVEDKYLVWSSSDSQNSTMCVKPLTWHNHFTDHYTAGTDGARGTLDEPYLVLQPFATSDVEDLYFDNFLVTTNTLYLNSSSMRANSYLVMPD